MEGWGLSELYGSSELVPFFEISSGHWEPLSASKGRSILRDPFLHPCQKWSCLLLPEASRCQACSATLSPPSATSSSEQMACSPP